MIDLTKDEKKKVVIELSDDEDKPKQAAPKAKAKAAPNLRKIKKQVKEHQKFTRPKPKNKPPVEAKPEKRVKREQMMRKLRSKKRLSQHPRKRLRKHLKKKMMPKT